jgi:murein L,D-transpeptidase YafK
MIIKFLLWKRSFIQNSIYILIVMKIRKFLSIYIPVFWGALIFYLMVAPPCIASGQEKIPDSIVSLSHGYIIVVDKQYQKIYVFNKEATFSRVFEASCSTGKNPGSKQVAGDARTPNGIFFATKVLTNPGPPEIYGSIAFPLDYPTISDKRAGRDGNNIWIHGTTKALLPTQSKGCVVLYDNDLKRLSNFIYLNRTPVIISESIKWVPQNYVPASKNELEKILMSWNKAFNEKDLRTIDSLYMQGTEIQGKRREELHDKIKNVNVINKHFVLQPRDISILQDGNNAVIIFDQIFAVNNNSFQGFYNKLILEKINNRWLVVDDASTSVPAVKRPEFKETDSVDQRDIKAMLDKWVTSWQTGDMNTYRSCYSPNFRSKEKDLDDWVAHKINVRKNSKNIKVSIGNIQVMVSGDNAKASFVQSYSSSILRGHGKKTLELKKLNNKWKISREIM